jgi:hypothetical protein
MKASIIQSVSTPYCCFALRQRSHIDIFGHLDKLIYNSTLLKSFGYEMNKTKGAIGTYSSHGYMKESELKKEKVCTRK